MTCYKPKVVEGIIKNTGWPIDGHKLLLALWAYNDYTSFSLFNWPEESDKAVMETMFKTETKAGICLYDTLEEFTKHWNEWEPQGAFGIPVENVEVVTVIREETKGD